MKKTVGRKSRDTLPLKKQSHEFRFKVYRRYLTGPVDEPGPTVEGRLTGQGDFPSNLSSQREPLPNPCTACTVRTLALIIFHLLLHATWTNR